MEFKLPQTTVVNKFISKTKIQGKIALSSKLKAELAEKIQKITWKHKLSESTLNTPKTEKVEEILIFEIELKQLEVPLNVLKLINKAIPYPILYVFKFEDRFMLGMALLEGLNQTYYFSEWDEALEFDFTGINLEKIYEKLIKCFVTSIETEEKDFQEVVATDQRIKSLEKEIETLKNKVCKEKQPNRQLEFNQELNKKKDELNSLQNIH